MSMHMRKSTVTWGPSVELGMASAGTRNPIVELGIASTGTRDPSVELGPAPADILDQKNTTGSRSLSLSTRQTTARAELKQETSLEGGGQVKMPKKQKLGGKRFTMDVNLKTTRDSKT
jgi:hypothetical protein